MVCTEVQMNDWVNMLMYIINGASFIKKKKKVKQVYRFSLNSSLKIFLLSERMLRIRNFKQVP